MFKPSQFIRLVVSFAIYWAGFTYLGAVGLGAVIGVTYVLNSMWLHKLGKRHRVVVAVRAKNNGDWRIHYGNLESIRALMLFQANREIKDATERIIKEQVWLSQNAGRRGV